MSRDDCSSIDAANGVEAASRVSKSLPSVVDEIELLLLEISKQLHPNVQVTPSVQSWTHAYNSSKGPQPVLDWSAVPAAVDSASTAMGLSTAKSEKKRAKKLQKLDTHKVNARVQRKRQQVESFLAVLQALIAAASSSQQQQQPLRVVDFGCGSGNLLLPLAALFPSCKFTGVDMKPAALQLLQQRATAADLSNVTVFEGMIEQYEQSFDVALALHACGNATDHVLLKAVEQQAAFVVSPCCVGKLKFSMTGGSSFSSSKGIVWTPSQPGDKPVAARLKERQQQQQQKGCSATQQPKGCSATQQPQGCSATQQQQDVSDKQHPQQQLKTAVESVLDEQEQQQPLVLQHPRSAWLRSRLPEAEKHFRIMARVADIAHAPADQAALGPMLAQRAAVADSCKRFVELDRCAAAAEAGYAVGLFKVLGAETMAKNDLLVGLPAAAAAACAQSSSVTEANATAATIAATCCGFSRWCKQYVDQLISSRLLVTAAQVGW